MKRHQELIITTIAVALILLAARAILRPRHDLRNWELLPGMVTSMAGESFGPSSLMPGGLIQQGLVEGVVPRGTEPFPYGPGTEEAQRAGKELTNPFAEAGPGDLDRGRRLYRIYCAICHDPKGEGHGPVVARGMLPPPSLQADRARALPDGTLFHILTRGQGNMASYEAQLKPADRWRVVRWVRELQGGDS
jgi:mono/diheme cytochrome c family protein